MTLAEISTRLTSGGTPQAGLKRYYQDGTVPFLKIEDLTAARTRTVQTSSTKITELALRQTTAKRFPSGTLLISMYGTVGLVKVLEQPMAINQAIAALVPPLNADVGFLAHSLDFHRAKLSGAASQTTQANISSGYLKQFSLTFPPLPEQRRIAEILDTLDRTIEATQRIIEKLQATRQGLLHDLLTRGLDENGQLRDPERNPELFHETELGLLPREWSAGSFINLTTSGDGIKPGPFGSSITKAMYVKSGYKVYGQEQVIAGDELLGDYFISHEKYTELSAFAVQPGDVLISLVGTVGKVLQLSHNCAPGIINPRLLRLRADAATAIPEFIKLFIQSDHFRSQIEAMSQTGTMAVISGRTLKSVVVPIAPLREQHGIFQAMASVDNSILSESTQLSKLQALKRGLMEDLLTGRVRVPLSDSGIENSHTGHVVRPTDPANSADVPHYIPPQLPVAAHAPMYRAAAGAQAQPMTQWAQDLTQAVQGQQVGLYSPEALDAVLPELLALTEHREGLQRVPEVLAKAGIRFMLLPHPSGSKANGAAFYLDSERTQPVIGLSLRFPYLDVFWFNLLHELAHIRLGHQPVPDESLEQYDQHSPDEQAANLWAQETLIPPQEWQHLYAKHPLSDQQLLAFARKLGRHVSIVAGRYGHETGNWGRVNSPKLRPSVVAELRALQQQLRGG